MEFTGSIEDDDGTTLWTTPRTYEHMTVAFNAVSQHLTDTRSVLESGHSIVVTRMVTR